MSLLTRIALWIIQSCADITIFSRVHHPRYYKNLFLSCAFLFFKADGASSLVLCPPHIASQIYAQNVEHFNISMIMNPIFERFVYRLVTADCLRIRVSLSFYVYVIGKFHLDEYIFVSFSQLANAPESLRAYEALTKLLTHFCFDSRFHTKENNWYLNDLLNF